VGPSAAGPGPLVEITQAGTGLWLEGLPPMSYAQQMLGTYPRDFNTHAGVLHAGPEV
jgi:hypothetical protein